METTLEIKRSKAAGPAMTSMTDSEFWRNLPYRHKFLRLGGARIDSTFPYRPRPRKYTVPTGYAAGLQGDVESVRHAVDCHRAELLSATMNDTADSSMQSSTEKISGQLSRNRDLEDEKGDQVLDSVHNILTKFQTSINISATPPDLERFSLDLGKSSTEDMARSWWSQRFPPLFRGSRPDDVCKSTTIARDVGPPICRCSSCSSSPGSLQSIETLLFSKQAKYEEIDTLRGRFRAINLTSWFRKHRRTWSEPLESLPLTAERLSQLRVRDINLEIERTQIVNELAMTKDLLRYILDAISRSQPHNQIRVSMIREYKRLKDQETGLVDHLQELAREMDHIGELENPQNREFADFSHESILPIEPPPIQHSTRQELSHSTLPEKREVFVPPKLTNSAIANLRLQLPLAYLDAEGKLLNRPTSPPCPIPWPMDSPSILPYQGRKQPGCWLTECTRKKIGSSPRVNYSVPLRIDASPSREPRL